MSRGTEALNQAYEEIPEAWYEKDTLKKARLTFIASLPPSVALIYYLHEKFPDIFTHYPYVPGLTAATLYIISALADYHSSKQAISSIEKSQEQGIDVFPYEANPLFHGTVTANNFGKDRRYRRALAGEFLSSAIVPPIGIAHAASKTLAIMNNRRISQRFRLAEKLARGRR